jgi:hypothetical protein
LLGEGTKLSILIDAEGGLVDKDGAIDQGVLVQGQCNITGSGGMKKVGWGDGYVS